MQDPVVASDGHSYERTALEAHMAERNQSPLTRELLGPQLYPNRALLGRIRKWREGEQAAATGAEGRTRASKRARKAEHAGARACD